MVAVSAAPAPSSNATARSEVPACGRGRVRAPRLCRALLRAQAIRDSFSLDITLYAVQNKERKRVMFNQDVSALGWSEAEGGWGFSGVCWLQSRRGGWVGGWCWVCVKCTTWQDTGAFEGFWRAALRRAAALLLVRQPHCCSSAVAGWRC